MPRNDDSGRNSSDTAEPNTTDGAGSNGEGHIGPSIGRRSYLVAAGATVGSAGLFSGTAAAFERRGIRFKDTVDMVADAGCDPTGEEPCDAKIREAADDYTLLKFPAGEYLITEKNAILGYTNLGFLGEGDARFRVPENFNEKALVIDRGTGLLFEGIDIDQRVEGATPGLHFGADDDLRISDVEFLGQAIHPDSDPRSRGDGNPPVTNAFTPIVRSESGTGTVTNVVAKNDGLMGAYNHGNGRIGVWIGLGHRGTVTLENCQFEGFPNNGLYGSRTGGVVQVEGGVFRNNDITQVRLSSRDSYVENATITVDLDDSDSPNPEDTLNSRGIYFEAGRYGYGGAEVRDCDVSIVSTPNSDGGVVMGRDGANHGVHDSRIRVATDGVRAVRAKAPTGFGSRGPPPEPHDAILKRVSITGGANDAEAIRIDQREGSVVSECCIHQPGVDRDGITLADSERNRVRNTTIDVSGEQLMSPGCEPTTSDLSAEGSCPVPTGWDDTLPRTLSIESNGGRFSYEFTVSGDLEKSTARGATIDDNDSVSGSTAVGQGGGGGIDSYDFSGEIERLTVDGDATVYRNGEEIDPDEFGVVDTLTIESGTQAEYELAASESLEKTARANATVDPNDTIEGTTATGQVGKGGRDSYAIGGEITRLILDGGATLYYNGESVDPAEYLANTVTIESESHAEYEIETTDGIAKSAAMGAADPNDTIAGTTASGQVGKGGRDSFAYPGEIERLTVDGDATVYRNGEVIANPGGKSSKQSDLPVFGQLSG